MNNVKTVRDQITLGQCNVSDSLVPDNNCIFELNPDYSPSSSLMAISNKDSVVEFCTDSTHIEKNPNKQNTLCSGESVWTVMSRHPDFANNK